MSRTIQNNFSS